MAWKLILRKDLLVQILDFSAGLGKSLSSRAAFKSSICLRVPFCWFLQKKKKIFTLNLSRNSWFLSLKWSDIYKKRSLFSITVQNLLFFFYQLFIYSFIHLFILFSIIIKQFNTKLINIKKIKKRKKQHNVRR